jgi:hypothetical protein
MAGLLNMVAITKSNRRLDLVSALKLVVSEIETKLGVEVCGFERVLKIWGANSNSFYLNVIGKNNKKDRYFLKFFDQSQTVRDEVKMSEELVKFLPTPEIVLYSTPRFLIPPWVLYKFTLGKLMSEMLLEAETGKYELRNFLRFEEEKEERLKNLYENKQGVIRGNSYFGIPANRLFYSRINGKRMEEFYSNDSISKYFNKNIKLNGRKFRRSIGEVFDDIRRKYEMVKDTEFKVVFGHGDAHHGNLLVARGEKVSFIDNEYGGWLTVPMECSKPYYNDLFLKYFYPFDQASANYFNLDRVEEEGNQLDLKMSLVKKTDERVEVAKVKLRNREKLLRDRSFNDVVDFKDYLFMCHTLARNPNNMKCEVAKYLFLVTCLILEEFDPLDPESFYSYF